MTGIADSSRKLNLEIARAAAGFFVVLIHVSALMCAGLTVSSDAWKINCFYDAVSRFSVPVFVMLSGYFTLSRDYGAREIFSKCARLALIFIFWSAVYALYSFWKSPADFPGAKDFIKAVISGPQHFWYFYTAAALYMMSPILRAFLSNASRGLVRYFLGLCFLFGSVAVIVTRSGMFPILSEVTEKLHAEFFMGFTGCYTFGYYVRKFGVTKTGELWIYALGTAGTAATFLGTVLLSAFSGAADWLLMSFFAPNAILSSCAFFVFFCKRVPETASGAARRAWSLASGCSLGIYIVHILALNWMSSLLFGIGVPAVFAAPAAALAVYIVSFASVAAIRAVPLLKSVVLMK